MCLLNYSVEESGDHIGEFSNSSHTATTIDILDEVSEAGSTVHQALLDDKLCLFFVLIAYSLVFRKARIDGILRECKAFLGPLTEVLRVKFGDSYRVFL